MHIAHKISYFYSHVSYSVNKLQHCGTEMTNLCKIKYVTCNTIPSLLLTDLQRVQLTTSGNNLEIEAKQK